VRLEEGNWRRELEDEHADDDDDDKVAVVHRCGEMNIACDSVFTNP
jgi:molybdopterin synthase catalytic subunit